MCFDQMKRLISYNPLTGVSCFFEQDELTKETVISHEYEDVAPLLERNVAERNNFDRSKQNESWWKVASIPPSLQTKWFIEEGIDIANRDHWPKVRQKLNDIDWYKLRTSPGKV